MKLAFSGSFLLVNILITLPVFAANPLHVEELLISNLQK